MLRVIVKGLNTVRLTEFCFIWCAL